MTGDEISELPFSLATSRDVIGFTDLWFFIFVDKELSYELCSWGEKKCEDERELGSALKSSASLN